MAWGRIKNFLFGGSLIEPAPTTEASDQQQVDNAWLDSFIARMDNKLRNSDIDRLTRMIDNSIQTAKGSVSIQTRGGEAAFAWKKLQELQKILLESTNPNDSFVANAGHALSAIEHETTRLAAEYETSVPGRSEVFAKFPLKKQCELLGIPVDVLKLDRIEGQWLVHGNAHKRPENAALAHFQAEGWVGVACEGSAVLMLMKASCLDNLASLNTFGSRADACMRFFEAQCIIHRDHAPEIVRDIERASEAIIRANLAEITAQPDYHSIYPMMDADALMAVWHALTPSGLATFARNMFDDPSYRAGWPDLTVAREGKVRFVEVKTTDKLHASQRDVILGILQPSGADVQVMQIKPAHH